MDKYKEIRPVVLGLVRKNNKILVGKGYDKVKKEYFYRCLGGGIEFLETSKEALKREFKEELNIDIEVKDFCTVIENIFIYQGKKAHELLLFYNIDIADKDIKEIYNISDNGNDFVACWVDINEFKRKEKILYPEKIFDYL